MMRFASFILLCIVGLLACQTHRMQQQFPQVKADASLTGTHFFDLAKSMNWHQRDSLALQWFYAGATPNWWKHFRKVTSKSLDEEGRRYRISWWVSPDYFVLGTNKDWVRVPITPMAAQQMMDTARCIFPTRKMVDLIYAAARVKLNPIPMYAFRDSGITMYQHHLIIEGQRKGKMGLIAGIKKDIITTYKLQFGHKANRVAIYGWHQPNTQPIQPLYTGHVNWYVDYSHGIRFIFNEAKLNGKRVKLDSMLRIKPVSSMLCNEDTCGYFRY